MLPTSHKGEAKMPVLDAEKTVLESITAMYDVCFQAGMLGISPGLATMVG